MKRILLLFSATVAALIAGAAVFVWTGRSSLGELQEQGRKLEQHIQQQVKEHLKKPPSPTPEPPKPKKPEEPSPAEPQQPTPSTPAISPTHQPTPQPPPQSAIPSGPPMEEINRNDKEKLIDILGE